MYEVVLTLIKAYPPLRAGLQVLSEYVARIEGDILLLLQIAGCQKPCRMHIRM